MEEVRIHLQNVQSHENTVFSIKPGMNFILAEGNNIGKSAIFKLLTCMASSPNVTQRTLRSLVRTGCNRALAQFRYGTSTTVFAIIAMPGESCRTFFETTDQEGVSTRDVRPPQHLLDALGIVLSEQGLPVNFNDADSVQLLVTPSTESDAVINKVLNDERVDNIKRNLYSVSKEVNADARLLKSEYTWVSSQLEQTTYCPTVDEFDSMLPKMQVMAKLADSNIKLSVTLQTSTISAVTLDSLDTLATVFHNLSQVNTNVLCSQQHSYDKVMLYKCEVIHKLLTSLSLIDFNATSTKPINSSTLTDWLQLYKVCQCLQQSYKAAQQLEDVSTRLYTIEKQLESTKQELEKNAILVDCPMRGKVIYGEQCLDYSN